MFVHISMQPAVDASEVTVPGTAVTTGDQPAAGPSSFFKSVGLESGSACFRP
jgi:hypothetical protein